MITKRTARVCALAVMLALIAMPVLADDAAAPAAPEAPAPHLLMWTLMTAFLVFFMQAGFAMVEAGFVRVKNVCNIIMKNVMDFSVGAMAFFFVGFGLMFGASKGWIGTSMFGLKTLPEGIHESWVYAFFVFQVVFAATSATIVSGAMAERTKFTGYLIFSFLICLLIYPIFGKWAWGNLLLGDSGAGWLGNLGFHDFAGSTVVHSVGGWAALAGAIVLGPRIGKYGKDGKVNAIPGHSMPLAAIGTFILFFGWFGFNAGSTTDGSNTLVSIISMNTLLAGAAGSIAGMITTWVFFKKPDTGLTLNGMLAGLVAITAGCDVMYPVMSIVVGLAAGALVVGSVVFVERVLKIDDPVGAISVHAACGVFGTLALGIPGFSAGATWHLFGVQAIGVGTAALWAFGTSFVIFQVLKALNLLRVTAEEEQAGLDVLEHGNEAYPKAAWGEFGADGGAWGANPAPTVEHAHAQASVHLETEPAQ